MEILYETDYLTQVQFESMIADNKELTALLVSIIKTNKAKRDLDKNKSINQ